MTETMTIEQYRALRFKDEFEMHEAVCEWLRRTHPDVPFNSDWSGIKLSIGYAKKLNKLKSDDKWPDLHIALPRKGFHGAYLELKLSEAEYRRQDGRLRKSEHIQAQNRMLFKLRSEGYYAEFVGGYDEALRVLEWYLK